MLPPAQLESRSCVANTPVQNLIADPSVRSFTLIIISPSHRSWTREDVQSKVNGDDKLKKTPKTSE